MEKVRAFKVGDKQSAMAIPAETKFHVLVVDDSLIDRKLIERLLKTSSYQVMFPLYHYQQKHPLNFVFLGLFIVFLSLSVGIAYANTKGVIFSFTGYTFLASKKGKDFSYLGPILFAGLIYMIS